MCQAEEKQEERTEHTAILGKDESRGQRAEAGRASRAGEAHGFPSGETEAPRGLSAEETWELTGSAGSVGLP